MLISMDATSAPPDLRGEKASRVRVSDQGWRLSEQDVLIRFLAWLPGTMTLHRIPLIDLLSPIQEAGGLARLVLPCAGVSLSRQKQQFNESEMRRPSREGSSSLDLLGLNR